MRPKTKQGHYLQKFNVIAGMLHLVQAAVLFWIANYALTVPIVTRFFDEMANGRVGPVAETLVDVPVALAAPVFLLLSALFHLFIASPFYVRRALRGKYQKWNQPHALVGVFAKLINHAGNIADAGRPD